MSVRLGLSPLSKALSMRRALHFNLLPSALALAVSAGVHVVLALRGQDARGVPLVVNDHLELAIATAGAGLHLGQDDLPRPAAARAALGSGRLFGYSTHSLAQAQAAIAAGWAAEDLQGTGFGGCAAEDPGEGAGAEHGAIAAAKAEEAVAGTGAAVAAGKHLGDKARGQGAVVDKDIAQRRNAAAQGPQLEQWG